MMGGVLTASVLLVPHKPRRQIAADDLNLTAGHSTDVLKSAPTSPSSVPLHSRPARFASDFRTPFSAGNHSGKLIAKRDVNGILRHPSCPAHLLFGNVREAERNGRSRIGLTINAKYWRTRTTRWPIDFDARTMERGFVTGIIPAKEDAARIGPWRDSD